MLRGLWGCIIAALCAVVVGTGFYEGARDVVELTAKDFDKVVHGSNYTSLVEFYAPWCGHCQRMKPSVEKAARRLAGVAQVAAVNCDLNKNRGLCREYNVEGYPTVMLFKPPRVPLARNASENRAGDSGAKTPRLSRHVHEVYNGARRSSAMVNYVLARLKNYVRRAGRLERFGAVLRDRMRPCILLLSKDEKSPPLYKAMALDWLERVDFYAVHNRRWTKQIASNSNSSSEFPQLYPATVEELNNKILPQLQDSNYTTSILLAFHPETDTVVEYPASQPLTKPLVAQFIRDQFDGILPQEGPLSDRQRWLDKLREAPKDRGRPKAKRPAVHDEL
ncbi:protein disulfide isomerase MPD1 KNAG_0G02990 [Huiozyma naganishii CBS 8797]|uniref:Thioredoxin domain-containing protein n=1 Tax=Huiozyma naganishii (strain ATCC MYA-139 / BCRC 22969 / CBS 8797 / KCTC 17520 / NBRC 10181 / NCYC 3082 / Yp74L-3) TaxID=1071383 RepID=J7S977_HUIN7|nr:hypothetical protein KNAG_0G02990 [Kazachstania naganishii CBS 8797]CCK71356.1 hypothetical protein KNAG_0G02990 [Kazachstania naganishii CBS 8797]